MADGPFWTSINRICIVVGTFAAIACAYYSAAVYYHWDAATSGGSLAASSSMTPWWPVIALAVIAVALFSVSLFGLFKHGDGSINPKAVPTSLRLQFQANSVIPFAVTLKNIWYWYALRTSVLINEAPSKQFKQGRQTEVRQWFIFLVFDKPVAIKQILVSGIGSTLPQVEVKDRGPRHAIIHVAGDIDTATMDITVVI